MLSLLALLVQKYKILTQLQVLSVLALLVQKVQNTERIANKNLRGLPLLRQYLHFCTSKANKVSIPDPF